MYPDKMPVNIGLYLTEEFKNYRPTDSGKTLGTTYDFWNLGMESAGMCETGLRQILQKVLIVGEKPPFAKAQPVPLVAVVEPAIERFEFTPPAFVWQSWSTKIYYKVVVYDLQGKTLWQTSVIGVGNTAGSYSRTMGELDTNPGRSATQAIIDGTDKLLEAVLGAEEIKALMKTGKGRN
ncbi:MAG: hypothetical protein NTY64_10435 [Deltaproteobacteria bacterium]|nr:hypothetical protein [Deltaproteobacteria bacterium]